MAPGKTMLMKPGEAARWRGRLRSLIEVASLVAPFVRGGQLIGRLAALGSALDAGERLYDRAVNDRLKANFETLSDVVTVLVPVGYGATALSARLPRLDSGAYILRTVGKGIDYAEEFMLPATFFHDLDQIVRDTSLGDPEKKAAIMMVFGRALRDGVVKYAQHAKRRSPHHVGVNTPRGGADEPAARVSVPEPAAPVAGRTAGTPVGKDVSPVVGRMVPVEGGAAPARKPTARQSGVHEKFDLSDVEGPAEVAPKETRPRPAEAPRPRSAEADQPPRPAPDTGQRPAKGQEPGAGEAGSPPETPRIRANRKEQADRREVWKVDAETIELGTRPDARARARAAEFAPMFAEWGALGEPGRKARIESLINAHLAREGIPPVRVKWGDKVPGHAEFNSYEWSITLSKEAVSADQISAENFATLVDNAVHEGRHAVTTFRGMRVALADNNYNPAAPISGRILAQAIEANRLKSPSDELSAEALGEAREIYEVGFAQDQRRAALGTEGVVDRKAVYDRKEAAKLAYQLAKVLHDLNVDEVKRGSAEHAEALRDVADSSEALLRAEREWVAAHNEYVALPEEIVSWRMGSAVKAAVLERLALQSRLTDLRQQYERATVEQSRKRQGGDREGADEALKRRDEAQSEIRKTQAEINALVSKEPKLVGGRIARQDQQLTDLEIARAPKAPEATRAVDTPATRGNAADPPVPPTLKPPDTTQQISQMIDEEVKDLARETGSVPLNPNTRRPLWKAPALTAEAQGRARQQWEQALLPYAQQGGTITQIAVSGVRFVLVTVIRNGHELEIGYSVIQREAAAPGGAAMEIHDALEQAAVQVAHQVKASSVRMVVRMVGNEYLRRELRTRGYEEELLHLPEDQRSWAKLIPVTPSSSGTNVPPAAPTDPAPPGPRPKSSSALTAPTPPSETPAPAATPLPPGADNEPTHPDIRPVSPEDEPTDLHIRELPEVDDTLVDMPLGEVDDNERTQVDIQLPASPRTLEHTAPPPPRTLEHTAPPPPPRRTLEHPTLGMAPPTAGAGWRNLPEELAQRIEALRTTYQQLAPDLMNDYMDLLEVRPLLDPVQFENLPVWTVDIIRLEHEFSAITAALAERYRIPFDVAWNQLAVVLGFDPELWSYGNPQ